MSPFEADPLDKALGAAIRVRRKQSGLSQSALAQGLDITFQQIQKYERGANRVSFSALVRIAKVLDCRISDLIGDLDLNDSVSSQNAQVNHLLASKGSVELLNSFNEIKSKALRSAVLELSRALAASE